MSDSTLPPPAQKIYGLDIMSDEATGLFVRAGDYDTLRAAFIVVMESLEECERNLEAR